ncbi:GNAT family N-acetyltransferase [Chloroflexi bacterium CFX6]|nr:GNAT family N-acetyltransferase [Chloroflexi bacterium CFX6]
MPSAQKANIMNKDRLLVRYDKDLRLRVMYPEARREVTGDVVRFIRKAPGMNFISFTFATEPRLERVIDSELDYFTPMNQPFTWKVYDHDRLPGLKTKLEARNFIPDDDPAAVMALDVNEAPERLFQPAEADIRRIAVPERLEDVIAVLDEVYGGHNAWVNDRLGMHLKIPGYLSVYAAYADDKPVSIAWTYFPGGRFATLFGGTTLAAYRGRGLYTGLLFTRLREIRARGYPFAIVEAGPMSKPIVEKHGFKHLTTVWDYEWNEWKRN